MKEGRDLVNEAVNDAKALKEAAISAAKNELVESMAPAIRQLLDETIKGVLSQNEGVNRLRRANPTSKGGDNWPGESHTGFEEAADKGEVKMDKEAPKDDKELDLESLASFFPAMSEEPEQEEGAVDENGNSVNPMESLGVPTIPTLGEGEEGCEGEEPEMKQEAKKKDDEEGEEEKEKEMDEEIEISESELKKVYEAALQTEAQVTKGFGEMTPMGELEDVAKDVDKGIADVKKGEHEWDKETPPAKQDFTVKEMKAVIGKGMAENKALRENLKKAVGIIRSLGARLHEVNLFNAKVLHVNRILNTSARLTSEQKKVVLESIDKATTIAEVKSLYEAISSAFKVTNLSEGKSRKPVANSQRARTSGTPDQKVLSESVDRKDNQFSRLQQLAGLVK